MITRLRTAEQERNSAQTTLHNERQHFMEAMQNMENEILRLQPLYQPPAMHGAFAPPVVAPSLTHVAPSRSQSIRSPSWHSVPFDKADTNGDGVIDRGEFDALLRS